MKSLDFDIPLRYDFKVIYHDYGMVGVQRVESEGGQYVSYEQYYELLKVLEDMEMKEYE